jgi:hypothetical protein
MAVSCTGLAGSWSEFKMTCRETQGSTYILGEVVVRVMRVMVVVVAGSGR